MNKNILRQVLVILATLATLIVNWLSNALPLNGNTQEELADRFDVYFVPAGYAFSIWGLIFLFLIGYSIYQALPGQRENKALQKTGYLYVASALANITWIFLWHYELFLLSFLAMLALLGCLIAVYIGLDIGREKVPVAEKWLVHITFSIYLGWITVATIANATTLLDYLGWNGWGIRPEIWTLLVLTAAVVISGIMSFTRADIAYTLVLIWAFIGIAVKHQNVTLVAAGAIVSALFAGLLLIVGVVLKPKQSS
jgi:benzodiazapine receptor